MANVDDLTQGFEAVRALREQVLSLANELEQKWRPWIVREEFAASAQNLAAYLGLRAHDLRDLQLVLTRFGLSSLGRSESRVVETLDALLTNLAVLSGQEQAPRAQYPSEDKAFRGARTIQATAEALFGPGDGKRQTRILVTLPTEAASNVALMKQLLSAGTECVRINCAHDEPATWLSMLNALRRAELELERKQRTRVLMDLGGPKVRTVRPHKQAKQRFFVGDQLWLTHASGDDWKEHKRSRASVVGCTLPQALEALAVGQRVFIDDGQLGAHVIERRGGSALLEIFQAPDAGKKIRSDKGLNFPDTDFEVSPLTPKDRIDLDFVARHADMVGYSFVQKEEDIDALLAELDQRLDGERQPPALVLKIETRRAVQNLPGLLVSAAGRRPTAVMIARGDLAVELGFRRMAEIQEEILWLCEAAHVPVIWATQVLETLAKEGLPTRAEVTDAAMASRAECVMLNKGPHVVDAVHMLNDVLARMQAHQYKKSPRLRILHSWEALTRSEHERPGSEPPRSEPASPL
jgi:pyruvate kinase